MDAPGDVRRANPALTERGTRHSRRSSVRHGAAACHRVRPHRANETILVRGEHRVRRRGRAETSGKGGLLDAPADRVPTDRLPRPHPRTVDAVGIARQRASARVESLERVRATPFRPHHVRSTLLATPTRTTAALSEPRPRARHRSGGRARARGASARRPRRSPPPRPRPAARRRRRRRRPRIRCPEERVNPDSDENARAALGHGPARLPGRGRLECAARSRLFEDAGNDLTS